MLPSATFITGSSGFLMVGSSFSTAQIRFALAILMVIMTNTMESIIRFIRMFMQ